MIRASTAPMVAASGQDEVSKRSWRSHSSRAEIKGERARRELELILVAEREPRSAAGAEATNTIFWLVMPRPGVSTAGAATRLVAASSWRRLNPMRRPPVATSRSRPTSRQSPPDRSCWLSARRQRAHSCTKRASRQASAAFSPCSRRTRLNSARSGPPVDSISTSVSSAASSACRMPMIS